VGGKRRRDSVQGPKELGKGQGRSADPVMGKVILRDVSIRASRKSSVRGARTTKDEGSVIRWKEAVKRRGKYTTELERAGGACWEDTL